MNIHGFYLDFNSENIQTMVSGLQTTVKPVVLLFFSTKKSLYVSSGEIKQVENQLVTDNLFSSNSFRNQAVWKKKSCMCFA